MGYVRFGKRLLQPVSQLLRLIDPPEVHEVQPRLLAEHVGVEGGDFDAVREVLTWGAAMLVPSFRV